MHNPQPALDSQPQPLRSQAEAADLRAELQSWTQDLYELRNVIDSLDEGETPSGPGGRGRSNNDAGAGARGQLEAASGKLAPQAPDGDVDEAALKLLKDLTHLSQQIASDAKEDAEIFARAAAASGKGLPVQGGAETG